MRRAELIRAVIEAALPVASDHRAGSSARVDELLAQDPASSRDDIIVAAMVGDEQAAAALLDRDATLATVRGGPRNWPPLLYLCFSRYLRTDDDRAARMIRVADRLLECGADANAYWTDPGEAAGNRETAIYGAAGVANRPELARLLLEHGADPNDGETPYHMVEFDGIPSASLIFPRLDEIGRGTALTHKADYPDLPGLRTLLELGADPNERRPFGNAAIHQCIFRGHPVEFLELLFEFGADPDLPDKRGHTPYALAARAGRREVLQVLERHGAGTELPAPDRLLATCAAGDTAGARAQLETQPDLLETLSEYDRSTLVETAASGNTAGVRSMLDIGFDIDTRGSVWNETATHRAAMEGRLETVRLLVENGADLTIRDDSYHSSPLGWAAHGRQREVLELLLQDPARLDLRDAVEYGQTARALELLSEVPHVDTAVAGSEPGVLLRSAADGGQRALVQRLLERGANPTLANSAGRTARDYAVDHGHADAAELLLQAERRANCEVRPEETDEQA